MKRLMGLVALVLCLSACQHWPSEEEDARTFSPADPDVGKVRQQIELYRHPPKALKP